MVDEPECHHHCDSCRVSLFRRPHDKLHRCALLPTAKRTARIVNQLRLAHHRVKSMMTPTQILATLLATVLKPAKTSNDPRRLLPR